jgi:hypothetical protein
MSVKLSSKDLISAVITVVMNGKQAERDDACAKLQGHINAVESERDALAQRCERLENALQEEREMQQHRQYPEPFRVGSVLGRYENFSYPLQILHVWNNWPCVDVEVSLPFKPALAASGESNDRP